MQVVLHKNQVHINQLHFGRLNCNTTTSAITEKSGIRPIVICCKYFVFRSTTERVKRSPRTDASMVFYMVPRGGKSSVALKRSALCHFNTLTQMLHCGVAKPQEYDNNSCSKTVGRNIYSSKRTKWNVWFLICLRWDKISDMCIHVFEWFGTMNALDGWLLFFVNCSGDICCISSH